MDPKLKELIETLVEELNKAPENPPAPENRASPENQPAPENPPPDLVPAANMEEAVMPRDPARDWVTTTMSVPPAFEFFHGRRLKPFKRRPIGKGFKELNRRSHERVKFRKNLLKVRDQLNDAIAELLGPIEDEDDEEEEEEAAAVPPVKKNCGDDGGDSDGDGPGASATTV